MAQHPFYSFMREAARIAEYGRGVTAPNPTVGALLVRNNEIVACGWHQQCGGAHAEVNALADARAKGINPADCTLVVTLEPCNHYGKTPPCSKAILEAGIRHVVIGAPDTTPKAAGGARFLAEHGVHVESGIAEDVCRALIRDFLHWQTSNLPYVTLKLASTIDGRIATRTGHSRWITGKKARQRVHSLRAVSHAVLIGGNTFRTDNPLLTCRDARTVPERIIPWDASDNALSGACACFSPGAPVSAAILDQQPLLPQPRAVVFTSTLPDPNDSFCLLQERSHDTVFLTSPKAAHEDRAKALRAAGVTVLEAENLEHGLEQLRTTLSCYRILCEGGGRLGLALLEQGLVNEFELHMAPKIVGDNMATPLFSGRTPERMEETFNLALQKIGKLDEDIVLLFQQDLSPKS